VCVIIVGAISERAIHLCDLVKKNRGSRRPNGILVTYGQFHKICDIEDLATVCVALVPPAEHDPRVAKSTPKTHFFFSSYYRSKVVRQVVPPSSNSNSSSPFIYYYGCLCGDI